jgi:hypothetical protein
MSDKVLNLKRSYGIITGHPNARYTQDGKLYDNKGVLIPENVESAPPEPEKNPPEEPFIQKEVSKEQVRAAKEAIMKAYAARRSKTQV